MSQPIINAKCYVRLLVAGCLAVSGCAAKGVSLISPNGIKYPFKYNSWSQEVVGEIEGQTYSGKFVTDSQTIYSNGTAIVVPGSAGKAILSSEFDTLNCEFDYDAQVTIGRCSSSQGIEYQLMSQ